MISNWNFQSITTITTMMLMNIIKWCWWILFYTDDDSDDDGDDMMMKMMMMTMTLTLTMAMTMTMILWCPVCRVIAGSCLGSTNISPSLHLDISMLKLMMTMMMMMVMLIMMKGRLTAAICEHLWIFSPLNPMILWYTNIFLFLFKWLRITFWFKKIIIQGENGRKNGSFYGFLISNWTFTGTFFLRKRFRGTANFAVKILTLPDKIASNLYWASLQNSSHFPNIIIYTILIP